MSLRLQAVIIFCWWRTPSHPQYRHQSYVSYGWALDPSIGFLLYELYMGKEKRHKKNPVSLSAAGRGRTGTILLPQDFESCASANSATAAYEVKQFDFST